MLILYSIIFMAIELVLFASVMWACTQRAIQALKPEFLLWPLNKERLERLPKVIRWWLYNRL
jgi:hypothetical protein